jgi:hypothetical protein
MRSVVQVKVCSAWRLKLDLSPQRSRHAAIMSRYVYASGIRFHLMGGKTHEPTLQDEFIQEPPSEPVPAMVTGGYSLPGSIQARTRRKIDTTNPSATSTSGHVKSSTKIRRLMKQAMSGQFTRSIQREAMNQAAHLRGSASKGSFSYIAQVAPRIGRHCRESIPIEGAHAMPFY